MRTEPRIHTYTETIGELDVKFEGEQYDSEILDTRVSINGNTLCWISWADKDEFINDLNHAITKYFI